MSHANSQPNRRSALRRNLKRSSRVLCVTGKFGLGQNVAVSLLDMSESGVRLVLKEELAPGHEVEVGLEPMGHSRPTRITGTVMWCVPMTDGNYCLGVRFDKPLKWTVLTAPTYW
jgi:hypothetical protein